MSDGSSQLAHGLRTWLICGLLGLALGLAMNHSLASAEETVTVQEILADPALFHLRQITLRGTVRNVQPLDPYEIPPAPPVMAATCSAWRTIRPSLPVAVPGLCGVPMVKDPDVEDGARVAVEATVQAPSHGGYALSFKGGKIAMDQEGSCRRLPIALRR